MIHLVPIALAPAMLSLLLDYIERKVEYRYRAMILAQFIVRYRQRP